MGADKPAGRRIRRSWPSQLIATTLSDTTCGSSRMRTAARDPARPDGCFAVRPLYTSHLPVWRKTPHNGSLQGLTPKKHGAKPGGPNPLSARVRQLEAKPDIGNTFRERVISGQYETESMAQRKQSGRICRAQLVLSWCLIWKSHAGLVEKGTDPEAWAPSCQRDFRGDRFGLYSDEIAPGSHGRR